MSSYQGKDKKKSQLFGIDRGLCLHYLCRWKMTIRDLHISQRALVLSVGGEKSLRQHLLDMGVTPQETIRLVKAAPMGDPLEIQVRGYILSLRLSEAVLVEVEPLPEQETTGDALSADNFGYNLTLHEHNSHPGLGEGGKYHSHQDQKNALPKDTVLNFVLAGQHNCGKTALFNQLTGAKQHVGNYPGVTVEPKEGMIRNADKATVTDLPGIYSLSPYSTQETVSRDVLLYTRPQGIINVVDAGNIERNLYLTVQLMELGIPMVLALNMMDEVRGNGGYVRVNEMERELGIPVVPICASTNEGVDELVRHAVHVARYREAPAVQDFCSPDDCGGAVHRCLHSIMLTVEDHAKAAGIPARFAASRLVEGDSFVREALKLDSNEEETIEHIILQMEAERGLDRQAAMADMRFSFIRKICDRTVIKPKESREYLRSSKIDRVLTGKWTALPIFVIIMALTLWLSIDVLGAPLQGWLKSGISSLGLAAERAMTAAAVSPALRSLVVDAVFEGVGAVLSFVPVIIILFFFLSILEDSGYMARVAFVTDKLLRKIGLSGRSIVPLLIGFGCSVPAVMASRTLPSAKDRKMTILLTPFMSCSAKITVYAFLSSAFFPGHGGLVLLCLYMLAIVTGVLIALVSRHIGKKTEPAPFVMELPNYRLPRLGNVGHLLWDKTKDFLQMAFSVILLATIAIWVLRTFDWRFNMVQGGDGSMLSSIAGAIAPVFKPLGLDDWKIVTALISGFLAKESIVSTMGVLGALSSLSAVTAVPMLVFCLLYTPCIAAIAAVRRELGHRWALGMIAFQCIVAWIMAFLAYQLTLLIV